MAKLHLVDATYELFRTYTAVPPRRAPDGTEVAAISGLISTILKLLRGPDVSHVACATDHVVESFRNDLFDGYKTGDGIPPDLWAQFPLAEEFGRSAGFLAIRVPEKPDRRRVHDGGVFRQENLEVGVRLLEVCRYRRSKPTHRLQLARQSARRSRQTSRDRSGE